MLANLLEQETLFLNHPVHSTVWSQAAPEILGFVLFLQWHAVGRFSAV